jgi:hypothetical protein
MSEQLCLQPAAMYNHELTFLTVVFETTTLRNVSEEYIASIFDIRACLTDYAKADARFSLRSWPSNFLSSFAVSIGK